MKRWAGVGVAGVGAALFFFNTGRESIEKPDELRLVQVVFRCVGRFCEWLSRSSSLWLGTAQLSCIMLSR
jgi:hypothetical protein